MLQNSTLQFLQNLKENNTKEWFETNRKNYENAKKDVQDFTTNLIKKFGETDTSIAHLQAKECLFRINRDVRFSADKSPYKINMGISVNKGGKKFNLAGYYIHIQPNESFVAGGIYMPMPPELKKVRDEIDYNLSDFKAIVEVENFRNQFGSLMQEELALKRVPKGYEADNPAAEYLKLKGFIASSKLTNVEITSPDFTENIIRNFTLMKPLIEFLNKALEN